MESALKSARVDHACAPRPLGRVRRGGRGAPPGDGSEPASAEGAARECVRLAAGGKGVAAPPASEREE